MRWLIASAVILGVLFWFVYFQVDRGVMVPGQTVLDSALQWVVHAVGNAIAVVSAFVLLVRALQNEPAGSTVSIALVLLAGLLLANPHWSVTLALAVLAASLILREALSGGTDREPQDLT
jgi:hypothetical protein